MEEKDTIRKLASVQKIKSLDPIEGADRIECATILGWKVVVRKDEFKVEDKCVYFEVDSQLPEEILRKANLWDDEQGKGKLSGKEGIRLRTIKLRKQISQGLALPIELFSDVGSDGWDIGEDITEALGVTKYDPPIATELRGLVKGSFPSFLRKTDSYRIQAYPDLIQEMQGREVYATLKVDGTSTTFYNRYDILEDDGIDGLKDINTFGVCSRNMELKEGETNAYWLMARKYDLEKRMKAMNISIQAETYGPGIQGNKLGTKELAIAAFDVFSIKKFSYLNFDEMVSFCDLLGLPRVQVVYKGIFNWTSIDELVDFSSAQDYPNGTPAEGIVIRPVIEARSEILDSRMAFKVISPRFLLKYHG
ncbi:MAG: RNA ligase (ATP) [Synergistaceae bacterium]